MTNQKTGLCVEKDCIVTIHYTLKDDDQNPIDSSEGQEPLAYLHGSGDILPSLEQSLLGKSVGDKIDVRVAPEDGYGEIVEDLVQRVSIDMFEGVETVEEGMIFQVQAGEDQPPQRIIVRQVEGQEVIIDGNHPLAGVALHFSVDIQAIRAATAIELEHGHVHSQ